MMSCYMLLSGNLDLICNCCFIWNGD